MPQEAVLDLAPGFQVDDQTAPFFDGERQLTSYDFTFEERDRKFIAMGLMDLANAIREGREPEVTGRVGLNAVALIYAMLESGHLRQSVSFADVVEDRVNAYQQDINDHAQ